MGHSLWVLVVRVVAGQAEDLASAQRAPHQRLRRATQVTRRPRRRHRRCDGADLLVGLGLAAFVLAHGMRVQLKPLKEC